MLKGGQERPPARGGKQVSHYDDKEERRGEARSSRKSVGVVSGESTSSSPHILDFRFWSMSLSSSSSCLA